jgi:hypothetical protein
LGGAIAVIITNNAPGLPPNPMAGSIHPHDSGDRDLAGGLVT